MEPEASQYSEDEAAPAVYSLPRVQVTIPANLDPDAERELVNGIIDHAEASKIHVVITVPLRTQED